MPPKGKRKSKPKIQIKESRGFVIGDFATVINNFWDEQVLKRFGLEQRVGFVVLSLLIVGVSAALYFGLRSDPKIIMAGDFNIAVASFARQGKALDKEIGYTVGKGIYGHLQQELDQNKSADGQRVELLGPDSTGIVEGVNNAAKLAEKINADMVIYGVVEETPNGMLVHPEFYLDSRSFPDATEATGQGASEVGSQESSAVGGQYYLGTPIVLVGQGTGNPLSKRDLNVEMAARSEIISSLAIGVSHLALHQYQNAFDTFQELEPDAKWEDDQGKEVLYALLGFAAGKLGEASTNEALKAQKLGQADVKEKKLEEARKNFELAEQKLNKALLIDPEYARPLIGLANLSYMRAILPFNESLKPEDIDIGRLHACYDFLDQADLATHKPPLADTESKIHFARGQCLFTEVYSGRGSTTNLAPAIKEFEQVISDFGDSENPRNPRIQELAAEAHGRLGLIYRLVNDNEKAFQEYNLAASLSSTNPNRQKYFLDRKEAVSKLISNP